MITLLLAQLGVQAPAETRTWMRAATADIRAQVEQILLAHPQAAHQALLVLLHGWLKRHVGMAVWEIEMDKLVRELPKPLVDRIVQRSQDLSASREDEMAARVSGEFAVAGALRGVLLRVQRSLR